MASKNVLLMLTAMALLMANAASIRDAITLPTANDNKPGLDIANCWNALAEIRQCSNEIIGFFLNGAAEIGAPCCNAIDVISHNCWPTMLSSLGYSDEQGHLLEGFCDKSTAAPAAAPIAMNV
ncbi:hypothetical protein Nepgr_008508 [Nepenthes gracilis]|uniref:Prolamin-like domain-containing protein n=1 Tax=Nepenthes gracilis TaxID=150966 RepID=A0AAD3S926_NEPGR|nr:hypothetical protein Nepgr_008508 [Nepenthes gracilis]